jgi:AcrR family transcriptional regulator
MPVKKVQKKNAGAGERGSAKPNAIVLAGLKLFTQYGYRKTSIDDIANAAQVAKRTVYLHFENKAAVFLAILEYLGDQVRQRCAAAESAGGTAVDRLTGLLDATLEWRLSYSANLNTCRNCRRLSQRWRGPGSAT